MALRYPTVLALTLALAASLPAAARPPHHRHERISGTSRALPALPASELYSKRALRRARTILELKLLELRRERLERVRKAIANRLPIDELLKLP